MEKTMDNIKCRDCHYCLDYEDGTDIGKCFPHDTCVYLTNNICEEFRKELENKYE